jgi:hypothetical protein
LTLGDSRNSKQFQYTTNEGCGTPSGAAAERGRMHQRLTSILETTVLLYMSGGPNPAYLIGAGFKLFAERPNLMAEFDCN